MGQGNAPAAEQADLHARVLAIMEDLELPSPARMLGRIEAMLSPEDRLRVLRAIVNDSSPQSHEDRQRLLKVLAGSSEDWAKAVDALLEGCRPS